MGKQSAATMAVGPKYSSKRIANFAIEWQNRLLVKRINNAKPAVNTKPNQTSKYSAEQKAELHEIEERNYMMARRLREIYGRKNWNSLMNKKDFVWHRLSFTFHPVSNIVSINWIIFNLVESPFCCPIYEWHDEKLNAYPNITRCRNWNAVFK